MNEKRQKLIAQLEEITDSDVYILFTISGARNYMIASDLLPVITEVIFSRRVSRRKNAVLVLETMGGDSTVVMALSDQLKENYRKTAGHVFNRCYSAGTIGMLATDEIYMSSHGLMGPVDLQTYHPEGAEFEPLLASYNVFTSRTPDAREREFANMYPDQYLDAILDINYSMQTIYPNFIRHCKPSFRESTWEYLWGGAGQHTVAITRTKAVKELGLRIKNMPSNVEEKLYNIISTYIDDTKMLVDSLEELEETDAYFETFGLSYKHFSKFQSITKVSSKEVEEVIGGEKGYINAKSRFATGWKKE